MKWQEYKEELKQDIAKAVEKAYLQMGEKSKDIDWFLK